FPNKDGGPGMVPSAGSGKSSIYMVLPRYQFILTGAYQAKYGITFGVNYLVRQVFSSPCFALSDDAGNVHSPQKNVLLVDNFGHNRLPTVHSFDARVSKLIS